MLLNIFEPLLTTQGLTSLLALTVMEVLLGVDNVIFVSIVLGRLTSEQDKKKASRAWMIVGIISRLLLLFTLGQLIAKTGNIFTVMGHDVSLKDIITLGGGLFLVYSTTMEIHNKLEGEDPNEVQKNAKSNTFKSILGQILLVDIVFSFDGIITAIGMVKPEFFIVRVIAVLIAMTFMFMFAPKISAFIHKHPTFKMLALSFLILIGVMLIVEGLNVPEFHIPHGTIYFAMAFSFGIELLNMQIRKKSKAVSPVELREPKVE